MKLFCVVCARILVLASSLAACSRGDTAAASPRDSAKAIQAPRTSLIPVPSAPYKVGAVNDAGTINGTIDFDGALPARVMHPTSDQNVCGNTISEQSLLRTGTRIGGVLVWLTDIRSGKPLPLQRRFELTNDHCMLDPHVQVILTSGTLNVVSSDRVLHVDRFIDLATGQTVALAPFNDDGEVVPFDHTFTHPAQIEVICDLHPWTHAWLAVLDHPYYGTSSSAGSFTIADIPAGKYHVRAWHPTVGMVDDSVTVTAGQPVNIALRLKAGSSEDTGPKQIPRYDSTMRRAAPQPSIGVDTAVDSTRAP